MMELDEGAKKAGITVTNEIGLDPGIDHLYAIKTIEEVHNFGGRITSFLSYCGGLPAPEASDNPAFIAYSNRDSTPYRERYNIPEAQTIIQGTLRYQGSLEFIRVWVDMGFLGDEDQ